jgi:hypothetical protein
MKFSTIFIFLVIVLTIMIKRDAECISVVKLSRLNQNMLKKLIGLRKSEKPLEEEYQLPKNENKNKKRERQVQEDNERLFGHYYEPRVGILNFYGSF